MNTGIARPLLAAILLATSITAACARDRTRPQETQPESPTRACSQCGIIEAISPRLISAGANGYYTYDLFVRMEKTGLLRIVPSPTVGPMEIGDRVQVMGGVAQPFL